HITPLHVDPQPEDTAVVENAVVETLTGVTINFSSGSVQMEGNEEINTYLKKLSARLIKTNEEITIVGHTDNTGTEASNIQLGQQRAASVKSSLTALGADPSKIKCQSKGESTPVSTNDSEEGKRQNRRVEILFNEN
ncbi:MAG: OmpA family protein, partial [Chitinophagales bacterium]